MILVDTNVLSEPLRPAPDPKVVDWLDAQALETLYISTISVAEIRLGVQLLPAGKRRRFLGDQLEQQVLPMFVQRTLSFDLAASESYAHLVTNAQSCGYSMPASDEYIAAIALSNSLIVATSDTATFDAAGLTTINPWSFSPSE